MKPLLLLGIFWMSITAVFGQSLSGNLRSEAHESSLSYGNVDIYKEDVLVASVLTDKAGNFHVALDTGTYRCVFNYAGYLTEEKVVKVKSDESSDFSMKADPSRPEPKLESRYAYSWSSGEVRESEDLEMVPVTDDMSRGLTYSSSRSRGGGRKEKSATTGWDYGVETVDGLVTGGIPASEGDEIGGVYLSEGWSGGDMKDIPRSGALTAGEVNDFSKWEMWQDLKEEELKAFAAAWNIAPVGRYTLQLNTLSGLPVVDAIVRLMESSAGTLFTSRTDNTGKAELWLGTHGGDVAMPGLYMEVDYLGKTETLRDVKPFSSGMNHLMLDISCQDINMVDIAFVVDATGSMGDELMYLQAEMNDVIFKAKQISDKLDFHFANVFYRDFGDQYVTQTMDFSRVLSESVEFVNMQSAGGGGDYEEAVEVALDTAINSLAWNESARSRILFLILDAPPHNSDANRKKMESLMRQAAEKGIRIVPVGASGINKATEYLLRTMAIGTNGTYTFLTNHSGIGNSHIEPSTDEYKVETFNDLMVRILKSYTYMPDCEQNIPELNLDYPDSLVALNTPNDSVPPVDSLDIASVDSLRVIDSLNNVNNNNTITEIEWSYYPNPTTGILNIKPGTDIAELFITDLSGKLLQSIKNLKKDRVEQADLSSYTTGIYLIRYLHEDRWVTGKVVLQRW